MSEKTEGSFKIKSKPKLTEEQFIDFLHGIKVGEFEEEE